MKSDNLMIYAAVGVGAYFLWNLMQQANANNAAVQVAETSSANLNEELSAGSSLLNSITSAL
ncbi:MAG: hypothetical protein ACRD33_00085 [Candidatus Acidiferrales bacterium]